MLYCTKCQTICEDSTRTCPGCKRSRGLRPIKGEDEVFFMKVHEIEAAEIEALFDEKAIRCRMEPVKGGFATSVYDPEFLPTDKNIFVEYQDLERANAVMAAEAEDPEPETDGEEDMPRRKRMVIQTVSIIAFMILVMLMVLAADSVANWLKDLLMS
ncbi:MAG: hypothetical protein IJF56_00575 [Clostridia bacterium]|nr:hypothetical protein [Clostridia bacterium]